MGSLIASSSSITIGKCFRLTFLIECFNKTSFLSFSTKDRISLEARNRFVIVLRILISLFTSFYKGLLLLFQQFLYNNRLKL